MKYLKLFLCALLAVIGCSTILPADEKATLSPPSFSLIPRKFLFGNPEKTAAQISPDGSKLAFIAPDENNILNVWVRDLSKKGKDIQITKDQKRGVRQFIWQYDQKHILYLQDQQGDENWHLYQTALATQITKDLTPFSGVKVDILSRDYHFPQELLIEMNKRNPEDMDVYRLNLQTGELRLDTENPGGVFAWKADHHLRVRIAESYLPDGSTLIRIRDRESTPWRDWLKIDPNESTEIQGFSADNQSVFVMTNVGRNTSSLYEVHLTSGEKKLLAEDADYDLSSLYLNPLSYLPESVSIEKERNEWIVLDPSLKKDFAFLSKYLNTPFLLSSRDLPNENWIIISQSDTKPNHYFLYRRKAQHMEFLFSNQPALERYTLNPMKPISFKTRDGMTIHGYVTLPFHKEPRKLPTVVLVHGGPWSRDSWGLHPMVQWLSNRGYAVLQVNFRGSTGYGKKYVNAGNREWGNRMHDDLLDGKKWMVEQGYSDPEKIAIFGGSYGGYATLVGLAFTPDEFCCGVDVVGPSNILTLLQTLPPYWNCLKTIMDVRVGKLETETEFLQSRSPLFKADQIKKPLLIAQGANDPRVKQSESDQIVAAMRQKKLPVEYLLFADEGHGFVRPENRLKFYAAVEDFLAKYLGSGLQEAPSQEENWEKHLR